jgi:hypothetical protein
MMLAGVLQRVGRRGAALLFFALLDAVICFSLLDMRPPLTPLYAWMTGVMPLTAWAVCWGGVGAVCLVFAFRLYDTPGFAAAVALKVAWGGFSLLGWLSGVERGYVSAIVWLSFAAFVFLIAGGIPAPHRPDRGWRPWTRSSAPR